MEEFTKEDFLKTFDQFNKSYVQIGIADGAHQMSVGEGINCLFCGEKLTNKNKTKISHLIPQLLGNHGLIFKDECDRCNKKFSKMESSLANYCSPYISLSLTKTKKGIPQYDNKGYKIICTENPPKIQVSHPIGRSPIHILSDGKAELRVPKPTYCPLLVYQALFRIVYILMNDYSRGQTEYIKDFLLMENKFDAAVGLILYSCRLLQQLKFAPKAFLYKKSPKPLVENCFTYVFVLYTSTHQFCMYIPYFEKDLEISAKHNSILHFLFPVHQIVREQPRNSLITFNYKIKDMAYDKNVNWEEEAIPINFKYMKDHRSSL